MSFYPIMAYCSDKAGQCQHWKTVCIVDEKKSMLDHASSLEATEVEGNGGKREKRLPWPRAWC
jgi:hypothetical protein